MQEAELSLTGKRWTTGLLRSPLHEVVSQIAAERGIDPTFSPSWGALHDPFALQSMPQAVERLQRAITQQERIGIIGDYDADGITATALLVRYLRRHSIDPQTILPHRVEDGYGVQARFIDLLSQHGVALIITVDCGVREYEAIEHARNCGIEVIVADHHSLPSTLPPAIILHPQEHSNPFLCGAGIAFTLIRALEEGEAWKGCNEDIALAALGTVADVVPLIGENRLIVQLGLAALNECAECPLGSLAQSLSVRTSTDLAFRIAPRINAAGRIADPHLALTALLEGGEALQKLSTLNEERQQYSATQLSEAEELLTHSPCLVSVCSDSFHPGIIGLIAGTLQRQYGIPSVVGSVLGDRTVCSLRSSDHYHIAEGLEHCADVLTSWGGHARAAGCTLASHRWNEFVHLLHSHALRSLPEEKRVNCLKIDAEIPSESISLEGVRTLQLLEPFGEKNREPLFLLRGCVLSTLRAVGKNKDHLQCRVNGLKAIGFGLGSLCEKLTESADIVCKVQMDHWQGEEEVQIVIEDIATVKVANPA